MGEGRLIELVDGKLPLDEKGNIQINFGDRLVRENREELIVWLPASGNITTIRKEDGKIYQVYYHLQSSGELVENHVEEKTGEDYKEWNKSLQEAGLK